MAKQLSARLAEKRAHARADVRDAILSVDGPEPADAALLILLEQQARAFTLPADVGVHLELVEGPARHGEDAKAANAQGEQDRHHVLEGNAVAIEEQAASHGQGERH